MAVPLSFEPLRGSIVMMSGAEAAGAAAAAGAADGAAAGVADDAFVDGIGMGAAAGALAGGGAESTFWGPPQAKAKVAKATIEPI